MLAQHATRSLSRKKGDASLEIVLIDKNRFFIYNFYCAKRPEKKIKKTQFA